MADNRRLGGRFARLWSAATASLLGDGVTLVAFPLLMTQLTENAVLIAGVQVARGLPWLMTGPFGGVAADRFDRRRLMIVVNIIRMVIIGSLAIATSQEWVSIALVYLVAFALGVGETFFDPAAQAVLPTIVEVDQLERANGRLFASESAAKELVGPAIGGALFAAAAWLPFLVDATTFAVAALVIVGLAGSFRPERGTPVERTSVRADLRDGWNFLRRHVLLRALALMGAALNFAAGAVEGTLVIFALQVLHVQDWGFGLLLAAAAIGGTAAALVADRVSSRFGPGSVLIGASAVGGGVMLAVGFTSNAVVCGVLFAVVFAFNAFGNVVAYALRQELTPSGLLGRVSALYRTLLWSAQPLGAITGGVLVQLIGPRVPIFLYGIIGLLVAGAAALWANNNAVARARAAAPEHAT